MNEKQFGGQIALLRKEAAFTQEEIAERLHVSPQAVSKWENGHSLPETALLPELARLLDVSIDDLFNPSNLVILEAYFGDGIEAVNVTKRLNRLIENDTLSIIAAASLLGVNSQKERVSFLTVKYKTMRGICYGAFLEGSELCLTSHDALCELPENGLLIIAGRYGTKAHNYDVMFKINHYKAFNWKEYKANHETFPSDPANDETEFLSIVYLNSEGIKTATCAEGEGLAYSNSGTELVRQFKGHDYFIANVPKLPPFGSGKECSWAASLTIALQAMRIKTTYDEVMGVSGACYRLAFCSPGWDYSSVDGLVAYDYATPGYAAFGFTPVQYCHIDKKDRSEHRARIMKEIRGNMPVLGINLRVAPEWGVICGYAKDGEDLYCRTKYDQPTIENDPEFMKGHPTFQKEWLGPYDYIYVDNWPFILCYFGGKSNPPSPRENLISSLRIFADCAAKPKEGHYYVGFEAYEIWSAGLRDDAFYEACDDEQIARRFSVNQFCALSLYDARKSAFAYLKNSVGLLMDEEFPKIVDCFSKIYEKAEQMHKTLDSMETLDGVQCRQFWNVEKRHNQAVDLDEMALIEKEAFELVKNLVVRYA